LATFKESLSARLPSREQVLPVFAVTVFIVFSWTLYRMFWYIPSWLGDFDMLGVLSISAYVLVFALFESALIFGILLLFVIFLPSKWFKDSFVPTSCTLMTIIGFSAYLLQRKMRIVYKLELRDLILYPVLVLAAIFALIFILSWFYQRFEFLDSIANTIAERMTVFLYIYIPMSVLSFAYLILRAIFR
jgi:hypothetical protein